MNSFARVLKNNRFLHNISNRGSSIPWGLFVLILTAVLPTAHASPEILVIDDFENSSLPEKKSELFLDKWSIVYDKGDTDIRVVTDTDRLLDTGSSKVLRIRGEDNSYNISKKVSFGYIDSYPYLEWKWKVTEYPSGADISDSRKDDSAAQIYVNFDLKARFWGYPKLFSVCYFYATTMDKGAAYLWETSEFICQEIF